MHEADVFYKNGNCFTTKSCDFYIKSNLMKNGSKFEAQYQPCLATEPIRSNPWKWQAGEVGRESSCSQKTDSKRMETFGKKEKELGKTKTKALFKTTM